MMKLDWIECKLEDILDTTSGGTPNRKHAHYYNGNIPWVKSGELKSNVIISADEHITGEAIQNSSAKVFPKGTILIALYGATIGRIAVLGIDAATNQAVCGIFETPYVYTKFTYHLLHSKRPFLLKQAIGGAQPNISQTILKSLHIALSPLPEQRAIVKKIEQLFSALDAGIADLKRAQEQLKVYRQSVLKKAFEGKFTNEDLGQDGLPSNWRMELLKDVTNIVGGVTKGRDLKDKDTVHLPYLRVANVQDGFLDLSEVKTIEVLPSDHQKYQLLYGDILYTEGGDRDKLGRGTIWKEEIENCIHQNHIFRARPKSNHINSLYISYYSQTQSAKNYFFKYGKQTTNLASINLSILSNLPIPICDIDQQCQVVKEIEFRLSISDALEQQINASLQQSEALRQSILKKAFAGELLTQAEIAACKKESDYEPASVLLKRIKEEKGKVKTIKKKITSSQEIKPATVNATKVSADIHAGLIAKIIKLHETKPDYRDKLSHIKCEKIAHLVEYHAQVPLGRQPVKDAAGPDDYPHLKKVESRAIKAGFFKIKKNNIGYTYLPGKQIDNVIQKFETSLSTDQCNKVNALLQLFLHFDLEQAEIAATTYAGWNNLIILGNSNPSDEEIVTESRENWSARKLKIPRERFFNAINWLRKKEVNLIPTGYGLFVASPAKKKK